MNEHLGKEFYISPRDIVNSLDMPLAVECGGLRSICEANLHLGSIKSVDIARTSSGTESIKIHLRATVDKVILTFFF